MHTHECFYYLPCVALWMDTFSQLKLIIHANRGYFIANKLPFIFFFIYLLPLLQANAAAALDGVVPAGPTGWSKTKAIAAALRHAGPHGWLNWCLVGWLVGSLLDCIRRCLCENTLDKTLNTMTGVDRGVYISKSKWLWTTFRFSGLASEFLSFYYCFACSCCYCCCWHFVLFWHCCCSCEC